MLEVYNYEPNFLFELNKTQVGRVRLIFCVSEKREHKRHLILFILQNGYASTINYIEVIANQIQNEILNKLSLSIVNDFKVYIVNYNRKGEEEGKDLTCIKFPNGIDKTASFSGDINYGDLGITKDDLINALNEYIADSYLPYQLLNPKVYFEDFNDNSTYYFVRNLLLHLFLREVKNTNYRDKVFKAKLRQVSIDFIKSLDGKNEITQSLVNKELSSLKIEDKVNSDCYDELERIFYKFTKNLESIKEEYI